MGVDVQLTPGRFIKNPGIRNRYKLPEIWTLTIVHTKILLEAKLRGRQ